MTRLPEHEVEDILENEIKSWFDFGNVLKNEEGEVFSKMLEECKIYEPAARSKGELFSTESLLMALIFNQQKIIKELMENSQRTSVVGSRAI